MHECCNHIKTTEMESRFVTTVEKYQDSSYYDGIDNWGFELYDEYEDIFR